jgi:nicotinamide mononucleotide transporter
MLSAVLFELIAFSFAIAGVLLTARSHVAGWILGIIGAAFYVPVFYLSRLYAETGLQLFYMVMGAFGFYNWIRLGKMEESKTISNITLKQIISLIVLFIIGSFTLAKILQNFSNTDVPYFDACMGISGLLITWMMARKYIENWICWVIVDLANAGLFIYKSLYLTAFLYIIMAVIALYGLKTWRKELAKL